jgi:Tfp pilus assembly protein PilN
MATTMIPPVSTSPPSGGALRFVPIRANLLPDEIISGRQTVVVRKQVVLGLGVLVALLVAWYAASWWQTSQSNSALAGAQRQGAAYQNQQNQFGPLVRAQSDVQTIQSQLQTLMTGDLNWKRLLTTLRHAAPAGVVLDTVSASTTTAAGSATVDATGTTAAAGQVSLSGSAPDKRTVAAYSDRLAVAKGLATPLISSVTTDPGGVKFTMSVVITSDAFGGRYSGPLTPIGSIPATTGGH